MRLPVDNAVITSHYGPRKLNGKEEFHDGLDFISRENNNVFAICDSVCSYDMDNYNDALRWTDKHHSAGNMFIIDFVLNNTLFHMRYLHISDNLVKQGQQIKEGELLGHYADVGYSFGAHLHNDLYMQSDGWLKINIEDFYKNLKLL